MPKDNFEVEMKQQNLSGNQLESSSNPSNVGDTPLQNTAEQLCRLCAKTTGKMVYIFSEDGPQQSLAYKINSCLPITVKVTDPLPKQLCSSCIQKLNIAYEFSESCVAAEDRLNACMKAKVFRARSVPPKENGRMEAHHFYLTAECTPAGPQIQNGSLQSASNTITGSNENNCALHNICSGLGPHSTTSSNDNTNIFQNLCTNLGSISQTDNNDIYITLQNACTGVEDNSKNSNYSNVLSALENLGTDIEAHSAPNDITCPLQNESIDVKVNSEAKNIDYENKLTCFNSNCFSCPLCCLGKMELKDIVRDVDNESDAGVISDYEYMSSTVLGDKRKSQKKNHTLAGAEPDHSDEALITLSQSKDETWNPDLKIVCNSGVQDCALQEMDNDKENMNTLLQVATVQKHLISERYTACLICGELFSSLEQCINHSRCHMNRDSYPCSLCNMCFTTEGDWKIHCDGHIAEDVKNEYQHFVCNYCKQIYDSEKTFNEHVCLPKQPHKCDECNKFFVSELTLQFHHNNSHSGPPICCELCNNSCANPTEYFNHINNAHSISGEFFYKDSNTTSQTKSQYMVHLHTSLEDGRPYACEHCGKQFQNRQILQGHYVTHMEVKPFKCDFCGLHLARKNSLKHHILSSHGNSFPPQACFQCKICEEVFVKPTQALSHMCICHKVENVQSTDIVQEVTVPMVYQCEYCEKCYIAKYALKVHSEEHGGKNSYTCKFCNATFPTYSRVARHKVIHMRPGTENFKCNDSEDFTIPRMFVCFECDKCFPHWTAICHHRRYQHEKSAHQCHICNETFESAVQLTDHVNGSHLLECKTEQVINGDPLQCEICSKTFNHSSTLRLHQHVHTKGKSYVCEVCGESFRLKNVYDKHYRKHTGERPFVCDVCGKTFSQNSGLYTHRRVHTGEKPYACDLCERTFRLKHDRDNHRRCHTGERPYKCQFCGKAFRTSHDHRQHLLIHTGQRPYECDFCGKGFRRINGLNVHKRIHTGEKPFGCEMCGRHFTQKGDMLKHRKTQHGLA